MDINKKILINKFQYFNFVRDYELEINDVKKKFVIKIIILFLVIDIFDEICMKVGFILWYKCVFFREWQIFILFFFVRSLKYKMCRISMVQLFVLYVKIKIYMYIILLFIVLIILFGDVFNFKVLYLKRLFVRYNFEILYLRMF